MNFFGSTWKIKAFGNTQSIEPNYSECHMVLCNIGLFVELCCQVNNHAFWAFPVVLWLQWCTTVMTQPYMLTFQKQDHDKPQDEHQSEKPAGNIWYCDFWFNHLYVISAKHNCTPPKNTGLVNPAVVLHDISLQSISLGHVCSTYLTSKLAAIHSKRVNCHPDYSTHKSSACTPVFLLIPYNW